MQFVQGFLKRLLFVCSVLALFASVAPAVYAQTVVVQGNKSIDSQTIKDYFHGGSESDVNEAVKNLYATGLFSDVEVRRDGGRVIVSVSENGRINHVAIVGNSKVKTEQIEHEIQSKSSGPYNPATVQADVERILDIYRRAGHSEAKVTSRIVPLPSIGRVDVVFQVNEGTKTGVKSIVFVGNHAFSDYRLRTLMGTTEMNFLSWLKNSDVYDPDQIATDEDAIRRFYLKKGYADFRIIGSDAQFDAAKNGYIITITLSEGPQYHVGAVDIESHLGNLNQNDLHRTVLLRSGDIYDADLVQKSVDALTHEVSRSGYAFSKITPRGDRNSETRTIGLSFDIEEGPRAYIERIDIHGNTRTRDYVIRREFDIGEGDPYNQTLIDEATRRLNALGFFKTVHVTNLPGSAPDKVIIDVAVEDKPTGSFGISGGYSTTDGFIAELSVTETNFLGRGQYVRASVSVGQFGRGVTFSFTQPYFLGYRMAGGFDLYAKSADNTHFALYSTVTTGATLRLGIPITDDLTFSPRYSFYRESISIPNTSDTPFDDCTDPVVGTTPGTLNAPLGPVSLTNNCLTNGEASVAIKQLAAVGAQYVSSVGYGFTFSTLDNSHDPTEGFFADVKQDVAGLGFSTRFVRTTGDLRYYHPILTDDVVGLLRLQGGDEFGFGGHQLSLLDNFNLGPQLVRGFAPGGIGPRDNSPDQDPQANSLGGTKYFGGTAEIDFPIWGAPKELGLRGGVFADAGTLFGYEGQTNFNTLLGTPSCLVFGQNFAGKVNTSNRTLFDASGNFFGQDSCISTQDFRTIRSSVGVSLIWASPIGPIRFDYSFVLSKAPGDVTQAFSFSGGTTF
jgi:outer membrane protein insertion porin family